MMTIAITTAATEIIFTSELNSLTNRASKSLTSAQTQASTTICIVHR